MKRTIIFTMLFIFVFTTCTTQKANSQEKYWCIATMELMNNFPNFNDPEFEAKESDLAFNLKQYSKSYNDSVNEYNRKNNDLVSFSDSKIFIKSVKMDKYQALELCKIWSDINDTNFEDINESRVGKDNSK